MNSRQSAHLGCLVLILMLFGCASSEMDRQPMALVEPGAYMTVAGGLWGESFDLDPFEDVTGVSWNGDPSLAASGRFGVRVNRWVAIEGSGGYFHNQEIEAGEVDVAKVDGWDIGAGARLLAPIDRYWHPYLLLGGGYLRLHGETKTGLPRIGVSDGDLYVRGGLGTEIHINEAVSIVLEGAYTLPIDDLEDYPFWTGLVGLMVRFGGPEGGKEE